MSNTTMHCQPVQAQMHACPYCRALFLPKRSWQEFCNARCRDGWEADFGIQGRAISIRKLKRGVSVVVHLHGPAAERALNLLPGELLRLVKAP